MFIGFALVCFEILSFVFFFGLSLFSLSDAKSSSKCLQTKMPDENPIFRPAFLFLELPNAASFFFASDHSVAEFAGEDFGEFRQIGERRVDAETR